MGDQDRMKGQGRGEGGNFDQTIGQCMWKLTNELDAAVVATASKVTTIQQQWQFARIGLRAMQYLGMPMLWYNHCGFCVG